MIKSWRNKSLEVFFRSGRVPARAGWAASAAVAARKLDMIEAADRLDDLRAPPGNRLEALKGDLAGRYSIRVNAQWRIIFAWRDGHAEEVDLVDYH
ncbi:plasmid maintenance system killer protein [Alkalicaulis satelles]|uniref:Plasmid maintenance system killer protein n=1 Tax=Alkalicaulis satelles TaxID=2609175 RepID=A0A5M6ZRD7_9PROT|nr:type II toxin-antitoxin system RelE/ParE family toxin [Alkalicaulis satelles]KAA5804851.1 plasmid maintenance system killer protein [Alkalicaulis satelles]